MGMPPPQHSGWSRTQVAGGPEIGSQARPSRRASLSLSGIAKKAWTGGVTGRRAPPTTTATSVPSYLKSGKKPGISLMTTGRSTMPPNELLRYWKEDGRGHDARSGFRCLLRDHRTNCDRCWRGRLPANLEVKNRMRDAIGIILLLLSFPAFAAEQWVSGDRLNRRTCPSTDCGVVGQLFHREGVNVLEERNGWGRIADYYETSCGKGRSAYVDTGNASGTPENGIENGQFAEWVSLEHLTNVRPPDPGAAATGPQASESVRLREVWPRLPGSGRELDRVGVMRAVGLRRDRRMDEVHQPSRADLLHLLRRHERGQSAISEC